MWSRESPKRVASCVFPSQPLVPSNRRYLGIVILPLQGQCCQKSVAFGGPARALGAMEGTLLILLPPPPAPHFLVQSAGTRLCRSEDGRCCAKDTVADIVPRLAFSLLWSMPQTWVFLTGDPRLAALLHCAPISVLWPELGRVPAVGVPGHVQKQAGTSVSWA